MDKTHHFKVALEWTGNLGGGTSSYTAYSRNYIHKGENKSDIPGSSAKVFRGDSARYNPEELLIASLSGCHMLWYLHLCADNGVIVTEYSDNASGIMVVESDGSGHFTEVTLCPVVTVKDKSMVAEASKLHAEAHRKCFIANSCNFPVNHNPECRVSD